jgi:hypothetical protein
VGSQRRRLGKSSHPIFSRMNVRSAGAETRSPLRSDERAQPAPLTRVPLRSVCSPAIEKMGLKNGDGAVDHEGLGLSAVCRKASIVVSSASCFRRGKRSIFSRRCRTLRFVCTGFPLAAAWKSEAVLESAYRERYRSEKPSQQRAVACPPQNPTPQSERH